MSESLGVVKSITVIKDDTWSRFTIKQSGQKMSMATKTWVRIEEGDIALLREGKVTGVLYCIPDYFKPLLLKKRHLL
jgi:hypothetical protein